MENQLFQKVRKPAIFLYLIDDVVSNIVKMVY